MTPHTIHFDDLQDGMCLRVHTTTTTYEGEFKAILRVYKRWYLKLNLGNDVTRHIHTHRIIGLSRHVMPWERAV